jgi:hypothetical protein
MSGLRSNIGPSSTKRRVATAVAVLGVILVGSQLARVWPRNVEVSYALDPGVIEVDVDYLQEGEAVASARFRQPDPKTTVVRHTVRLQPGEYQARITVYRSDGPGVEHARVLVIPAEGLTRFDLKEASTRSE